MLTWVTLAGIVLAQEADDLEDVLSGFEKDEACFQAQSQDLKPVVRRRWDISGSLEISGSFNYLSHHSDTGTDYQGLQRLRNRLNLQFDLELSQQWVLRLEGWTFYDAAYSLNERGDYTREVLNEYELDADLGEAWIRGELHEAIDIKFGRQVVIWGRSETLRVLDILNPLDNREPGRVDLEDLRRPLGILKIDGYTGDWSVTALAIPEIRFDLNPVKGSDFYPGIIDFHEKEPDDFKDTELAVAAMGIFEGWDISFHAAWFWNDQPRFRRAQIPLILMHDRLLLLGSGANYTSGSWLLKYEFAYVGGIGYFNAEEKDRLDALLGIEYYGVTDTTIVVEGLNRHILDYEQALRRAPDFTRRDTQEMALRVTRDLLNDTLHVTALGILFSWDGDDGAIGRFDIQYDLRDGLKAGVGILAYHGGDLPTMDGWARYGRLIFNLKWSF